MIQSMIGLLVQVSLIVVFVSSCTPMVRTTSQGVQRVDVSSVVRESPHDLRKRIMILPVITDNKAVLLEELQFAHQQLVKELTRDRLQFMTVSHLDFPQPVETFLKDGRYDLAKISAIAKNLGISALLEARVVDITAKKRADSIGVLRKVVVDAELKVAFRTVSTSNNKEVLNQLKTASVSSEGVKVLERDTQLTQNLEVTREMIRQGLVQVISGLSRQVSQVIERLGWEGRIAAVEGERIFVNAGRMTGLQMGDILKVLDEGQDIFDPQTGVLIGHVPGRLKGTVEIISYFGQDGSIAVIHSGAGFSQNDRVELY